MTEEMKDAIRQMVAGTSADNLERVANLSEEAVLAELGVWSANQILQLNRTVSMLISQIDEHNAAIAILTPFADKSALEQPFI